MAASSFEVMEFISGAFLAGAQFRRLGLWDRVGSPGHSRPAFEPGVDFVLVPANSIRTELNRCGKIVIRVP